MTGKRHQLIDFKPIQIQELSAVDEPKKPNFPGMQGGKKRMAKNALVMQMRKAGHLTGKDHIANLIASQGASGVSLDE